MFCCMRMYCCVLAAESELVDGKAPTGADVAWVEKEPSYFFKLSEYKDKLLQYYEAHPDFIAPAGTTSVATVQ